MGPIAAFGCAEEKRSEVFLPEVVCGAGRWSASQSELPGLGAWQGAGDDVDRSVARLRRLVQRMASRSYDYEGLRAARSSHHVIAWARHRSPPGFNGNALRARIALGITVLAPCHHFIETGTSHAATAIGASRLLRVPVWSCEISKKDYVLSRLMTVGIRGISLFNIDSREFIDHFVPKLRALQTTPIIYLDAHEGVLDRGSLPLVDEIRIVLQLEQFAVMIDDFRVPQQEGFSWGAYGNKPIDVELIRDILLAAGVEACYFPAYPASNETGHTSGYCVFWRSLGLDGAAASRKFPLDLLRAFSIVRNDCFAVP